ncbi:hypothetical protein [Ferruginibacter sp. SUN106]|uniref:hypothetical protein n=1 Tax=Ferruginibacter sp. SUN106 TaxID=2978348 RepID=UPI003D36588A
MKIINNKLRAFYLVAISGSLLLTACNKDLEQLAPIAKPTYPSGLNVAATIAANPNDSLFYKMIVRTKNILSTTLPDSNLVPVLSDSTKTFTIFAVDNAGMKVFVNAASGGAIPINAPDAAFVSFINNNAFQKSAYSIIKYLILGQKVTAGSIGVGFPNYPFTTQFILDTTQQFVRMNIFPARGTPYSYVNNIPLTAVDQGASNGIIHHTYTVVAPPSATLKTMLAAEPSLSFFRAAVARADSGSVGLSKFDSLLNYGVTNMTVLAPNDVAFQNLLIPTITQALIAQGVPPATAAAQAAALASTPAVFSNPALYGALTASTVKSIIAYHLLASLTTSTTTPYQPNIRVFSNNISAIPIFIKTLVNNVVAVHPGVMAQSTYAGPAVTSLKFSSYGTFPPGGAPFSYTATAVTMDKFAVNGVYHIIDKVLLPQ